MLVMQYLDSIIKLLYFHRHESSIKIVEFVINSDESIIEVDHSLFGLIEGSNA